MIEIGVPENPVVDEVRDSWRPDFYVKSGIIRGRKELSLIKKEPW